MPSRDLRVHSVLFITKCSECRAEFGHSHKFSCLNGARIRRKLAERERRYRPITPKQVYDLINFRSHDSYGRRVPKSLTFSAIHVQEDDHGPDQAA